MEIAQRNGRITGRKGIKTSKNLVKRYFHERHVSKVLEKPVEGYIEIKCLHFLIKCVSANDGLILLSTLKQCTLCSISRNIRTSRQGSAGEANQILGDHDEITKHNKILGDLVRVWPKICIFGQTCPEFQVKSGLFTFIPHFLCEFRSLNPHSGNSGDKCPEVRNRVKDSGIPDFFPDLVHL